jgi:hypothetical protein
MIGKEVFSRQLAACLPDRQVGSLPAGQAGQQLDVDLSSLPKGLYIFLIKEGDNFYQRKIIVE